MEDNKQWPNLMELYKPTVGTLHPQLVVCLEGGTLFAGMVINDMQREACKRLFKRMVKGPIVKVYTRRWVIVR
jgi:hypothetical protein